MEYWQIFGIAGAAMGLIPIVSFRWRYSEGKMEILGEMLDVYMHFDFEIEEDE